MWSTRKWARWKIWVSPKWHWDSAFKKCWDSKRFTKLTALFLPPNGGACAAPCGVFSEWAFVFSFQQLCFAGRPTRSRSPSSVFLPDFRSIKIYLQFINLVYSFPSNIVTKRKVDLINKFYLVKTQLSTDSSDLKSSLQDLNVAHT